MSQDSKEALRKFEQKMREQGADGFADGPRPWEHWDESGHQASNRIWEGSARRIYPGGRKAHSLGHRLLSVLTFIALTALLVGIGGVYFSHTQSQLLAINGVQPLPFTGMHRATASAPANEMPVTAPTTTQTHDLETLPAPAAGSHFTRQQQPDAVVETAATDHETTPSTNAAAVAATTQVQPVTTGEANPPATGGSVDSVAIETVVTEESVTTTVYTRHPRQEDAEVVAAIETTPPPFAHRMDNTGQAAPDTLPSTTASADTGYSGETAAEAADTNLQLLPIDAPAALEAQPDALSETAPVEHTEALEIIAATDMSGETATAESSTEVDADIETDVSSDQNDALPDNTPAEQAEAASIDPATADTGRASAAMESPAEAAAGIIAAAEIETQAPVAKTGDWVINLASYTRESMASRKLALFQQKGVDAEVFAVTINDKPMYRIRVTGYESSRSAKADIPSLEQKLNLEGAWISRR